MSYGEVVDKNLEKEMVKQKDPYVRRLIRMIRNWYDRYDNIANGSGIVMIGYIAYYSCFRAESTINGADNWYHMSAWGRLVQKLNHAGRKEFVMFEKGKTSDDYINIFLKNIPSESIKLNEEVDSIDLVSDET